MNFCWRHKAVLLAVLIGVWCDAAAFAADSPKPAVVSPPVAHPSIFDDQPLLAPNPASGATVVSGGDVTPSIQKSFDLYRVGIALGVVLGSVLLLRWMGQRFLLQRGINGSAKAVKVLSRSMVSPRQQVLLLQVGRRVIVVGDSGGQMHPLGEITEPDEVAELIGQSGKSPLDSGEAFGAILRRADEPFAGNASQSEAPDTEMPDVEPGNIREEISGLMSKVRLMQKKFNSA